MQEIELKFLVPEYRLDGLMRQTKVKSSLTSLLAAHYFDTPDQVLAANGMALRIRKEGDRWVQTLKSNGDGMASRGEQNNVLDSQMVAEALATDSLSPDLSLYDTLDITQLVASPIPGAPLMP
nr:CYTH domain-containing protein [Psychrobacter sp. PraFG1]UNK04506.1 CYTH domain-containing protein [Psychrobacter sp. PraFG1]